MNAPHRLALMWLTLTSLLAAALGWAPVPRATYEDVAGPGRLYPPLALAGAAPDRGSAPLPSESPSPSPEATPRPTASPAAAQDTPGLYAVTSSYVVLRLGPNADSPTRSFHFGAGQTAFSRGQGVAGDFDGDGADTIGVYDSRQATFTLASANRARAPATVIAYGQPIVPADDNLGAYALAGDFDGDGVDTIGLFDPATNVFRLRNANAPGPPDRQFQYGSGIVRPIVGDWDGDGIDTVGVVDPQTGTAYLRNTNAPGNEDIVVETGHPRLLPVAGDFDGDGVDTVGMYSGENHTLYVRAGHSPGDAEIAVPLSSRAAVWGPIAGRWDTTGDPGEYAGFDWPTAAPADEGMDPARRAEAVRRGDHTENLHSLLVVRHGKLVTEAYYNGYDASMANCLKSVSKSVLSALFGLAIADGHVAGLEEPVSRYLPGYFRRGDEPRLGRLSLYNLLTRTSGQAWSDQSNLGPMIASGDWVAYVAGRPFVAEPGARWNYSTGLTHVASAALTEATGRPTHEYAEERLFEPLGISASRWDWDPDGRDFGGAEVWMRPRDMARFGQLYLRRGEIDGHRILKETWVRASTAGLVAASGGHTYGMWWWRRDFAGHDTYFAWGYGGQFIFVVQDLDMVVVFTSAWFRGARATTNGEVFRLLADYILPAATGD